MRVKWLAGGLLAAGLVVALAGVRFSMFDQRPVPAVTVTTLQGEQYRLDAMRGQVLLVNFWATTCTVCIREMPKFIALFDKYQSSGYRTVAVAMPYDPPNRVVDYTSRRALPFDVALDVDGQVLRAFGDVPGTPTVFLVDKRGMIVHKYLGEPDFEDLEKRIRAALAERA